MPVILTLEKQRQEDLEFRPVWASEARRLSQKGPSKYKACNQPIQAMEIAIYKI